MNNHYHEDHTQKSFDARNLPNAKLEESSIYYLVYQVKVSNATWYHHTLMLADDIDDFMNGTNSLQEKIRESIHPTAIVTLVFTRNLYAENESIVESAFGQKIYKDITDQLSSGRKTSTQFMVFGLIGEDEPNYRMTLINVNQMDASNAIKLVQSHVLNNMHEPFFPLNVCLVHPVTQEIMVWYQATSDRLMATNGITSFDSLALH